LNRLNARADNNEHPDGDHQFNHRETSRAATANRVIVFRDKFTFWKESHHGRTMLIWKVTDLTTTGLVSVTKTAILSTPLTGASFSIVHRRLNTRVSAVGGGAVDEVVLVTAPLGE